MIDIAALDKDTIDLNSGPLSLPKQIAEDVARRILAGEVTSGQRLNEIELAHRYGVSRGPIRDAIRELTRSGLAEMYPRRGAFVAQINSNIICDMYNLTAGVVGLAAHYCALFHDSDGIDELSGLVEALESLIHQPQCSPKDFALGTGKIGSALGRNCHSDLLKAALADRLNHTLWSLIYREKDADYTTADRRTQVCLDWRMIVASIRKRENHEAESLARKIIFDGRDEVLRRFRIPRSEPIQFDRFIRDNSG